MGREAMVEADLRAKRGALCFAVAGSPNMPHTGPVAKNVPVRCCR